MLYVRMGPTPWVSTNQPSGVSIGGPQLPSWMTSHDCCGIWSVVACSQMCGSSENAMAFVSRSKRDSAANRPVDPAREQGEAFVGRDSTGE